MKEITNTTFFVIGIMSGTSLDGVDLAYVKLDYKDSWHFDLINTSTQPYALSWQNRLKNAHLLDEDSLLALDKEYTALLSEILLDFKKSHSIEKLDAVCSHGHTVLHQPNEGRTYQIGNRSEFAKNIGHTVVCDFRTQDVAFGGQGAPLVPVGDRLLFHQYDACLNIGGFANSSVTQNSTDLVAFDLCPVNTVLNRLVKPLDLEYDPEGSLARKGKLIPTLLAQLNALAYYHKAPPKSLGIEWVTDFIFPVLSGFKAHPLHDLLHTFSEHVVHQVGNYFMADQKVLVTGGGCFNSYLMERIQKVSDATFILPDENIINYKEALIFGLLGVLKLRGEINCWSRVTGSDRDHSSGVVFSP